jgi:hypothetical protein
LNLYIQIQYFPKPYLCATKPRRRGAPATTIKPRRPAAPTLSNLFYSYLLKAFIVDLQPKPLFQILVADPGVQIPLWPAFLSRLY